MGLRNETVADPAGFGDLLRPVDGMRLAECWGRCSERLRAELGE